MKKQLKSLNINLAKGFFAASLIISFSCTQEESFDNIENKLIDVESNVKGLSAKKKNPTDLGGSRNDCDNPFNSSTGMHYRQYESTDVGAGTDLVSKTAENGQNVDVIKFLDDRTCAYNYSQSGNVGIYKIAAGSNEFGSTLQPRIERATKTVNRANGNFVSLEGTVKIKRVGNKASGNYPNDDLRDQKGSYIIQAKGTHSNVTIGSSDPAILLVLAKDKGNGTIDLWSEQITKRGGSGNDGRDLKFIKNVAKNATFDIKMVNGFSSDTKQYVKIYINGTLEHTHNVPNTKITVRENGEDVTKFQTGKNAKIRFGVYRCVKGEANIEWSNVKHDFKG